VKIVVAGGSGVLGRALVRCLLDAGHEVIVLTRYPRRAGRLLRGAATIVEWRPTGTDTRWTTQLVGASGVVDVAAAGAVAADPLGKAGDGRLAAITALVDGIAAVPSPERPGVLVSASSAEVYAADEAPVTETSSLADTDVRRRLCLLEAAASDAEELDVRVVLLRMGRLGWPARATGRSARGAGIALDDLVALAMRALTGWDLSGPLNAVAPDEAGSTPGPGVWPAKALAAGFVFRAGRVPTACSSNATRGIDRRDGLPPVDLL
jgi:NAD dependent epimerase/dehydratase family enzyme